ncbi:PucR family transcriptional regulator [Tumebacillus algifaecis]|nr:PucR family transcriptional regulator [Tumebacillus algifaecis]
MKETERLAAALLEYGSVERTEEVANAIDYVNGVWYIPLAQGGRLRLEAASLPHAVGELLALYAKAVSGGEDGQRLVQAWLGGERDVEGETLIGSLQELGWRQELGVVVLLELERATEPGTGAEAVALLRELIEPEQAVLAVQGTQRVWLLVPVSQPAAKEQRFAKRTAVLNELATQDVRRHSYSEQELEETVSAWIATLGAELFLLGRGGLSSVRSLEELALAKREAEFALEAGKRFRSKDVLHAYHRLGMARLLYGTPQTVCQEFVREILPAGVLEALTPELRETVVTFVEHGQQVADTARALFVHRNTLLYRLERIHELTGYDPRQPQEGWTLWLALLLLRADCTNGRG